MLPEEFLSAAEHSGLIRTFGAWMVRSSLRQAQDWLNGSVCSRITMAVNVSQRELTDPRLVDTIAAALNDVAASSDTLSVCLEVTETSLAECPAALLRTLEALKELGVRLAIDDFGTRYASLDNLRRIPVDVLKIDRSFVAGLGSNRGGTTIIEAVVDMGAALGLTVVAEGVETQEQLDSLRALGCDLAQGHHFSPPLAAAEVRRLMARDPRW